MIRVLVILFALLLLLLSYVLLKKPQLLTPLLIQEEIPSFLKTYGHFYLSFGILGFIAAIINLKIIILLYIFLVLILASSFSLKLAKSLKK